MLTNSTVHPVRQGEAFQRGVDGGDVQPHGLADAPLSAQVQRRLRAVFATLLEACPPDQHPPLLERVDALDAQLTREWTGALDLRLASVADPQGLGSEAGATGRIHPLIIGSSELPDDRSSGQTESRSQPT